MTDRSGSVLPGERAAAAGPLRVLVVDDHQLFRRGLQVVLAHDPGIVVVGEAGDGAQGVEMVNRLRPDLVLMDVRMPGGTGIQACREMKRHRPDVSIVILTMSDTDADLLDALRAGAAGYLFKESSSARVVATVRSVAAGGSVIGATMAARLLADFDRSSATGTAPERSEPDRRERDVLEAVAAGSSHESIGRRLDMPPYRVAELIRAVLEKVSRNARAAEANGPTHAPSER